LPPLPPRPSGKPQPLIGEVVLETWPAGIGAFSAQQQQDAASEEKIVARRPRRNHSPAFKAKVAVAAIKGEETLIELAQDVDLHLLSATHAKHVWKANQIKQRRDQRLEGATGVFGDRPKAEPEPVIDVKTLHAKIGDLTQENVFCPARSARRVCCRAARQAIAKQAADRERIKMIDPTAKLSISRQAKVPEISQRVAGNQPGISLLQAAPGLG
jgi:transposase